MVRVDSAVAYCHSYLICYSMDVNTNVPLVEKEEISVPSFSKQSLDNLSTCDIRLQKLFLSVVKEMDCTILCGYRNEEDQERAFQKGLSKVHFPHSKHNTFPSVAVDVVPYPIDWNDRQRFVDLYHAARRHAIVMRIRIRWGADWDMDGNYWEREGWEVDGPHFELAPDMLKLN